MKAVKWTKEESILVLDLYFKKPVGMKKKDSLQILDLAKTIGRSPSAVYRRMYEFLRWYPTIPLPFYDDLEDESDPFQPFWNGYFLDLKKLHKDAESFLSDIRVYTLTLHLYFQLIPDTMTPKVPEVIALAKMVKRPPALIVEILHNYLSCDPFMRGKAPQASTSLHKLCRIIWERYEKNSLMLNAAFDYIAAYYRAKKRTKKWSFEDAKE